MTEAPSLKEPSGTPLRVLVVSMLLSIGLWSGWNVYSDYQQLMESEYRLLEAHAKQNQERISGAIRSVGLIHKGMIDKLRDLHDHHALPQSQQFQWLDGYLTQLPEVHGIFVVDATGHIVATNTAIKNLIGFDASSREYFTFFKNSRTATELHISPPFMTAAGIFTSVIARAIHDNKGNFAGVVAATIEPDFFANALKLEGDLENGLEAVLIHKQGGVLSSVPNLTLVGQNLHGGVAFSEHTASGMPLTRHFNVAKLDNTKKLGVFQDIPNSPFTVILSRKYDSILQDWQAMLFFHVLSFVLLSSTSLLLLTLASRRQQSLVEAHRQLKQQVVEIQQLQARLHQQVIRDPLTGLYNRRYLDETLPRDLALAKREGHSLAVAMIDLDHFKQINDTYGHAGGDEVLISLSRILTTNARESDIICRYGGEEFLVALPKMSVEQAKAKVEQWLQILSNTKVQHGDLAITVTFSAGIAAYPEHGVNIDTLVKKADEALYQSKAAGRNRVTCFTASNLS